MKSSAIKPMPIATMPMNARHYGVLVVCSMEQIIGTTLSAMEDRCNRRRIPDACAAQGRRHHSGVDFLHRRRTCGRTNFHNIWTESASTIKLAIILNGKLF